jgi:hypothetical protein
LLAWSIPRHWCKSHRWIGVAARSTVFVYNKTTQSVQPCCLRCSTSPVPSRRDAGQPHRRVVFRRRRGQVRPVRGRDLESNGRVSGRTHFRKVRGGSWNPQHSLELPQVPTSTAFALASTTSRGVTHSGQLCALSGVIVLCFLSDKSGRNIGSKITTGRRSVTSSR